LGRHDCRRAALISISGDKQMKRHKSLVVAALIAMVLMAVAISVAQTTTQQSNQKKQAESCCAMDSCCCHNDSGAVKTGENGEAAKGGCCGDSCSMKIKHHAKNDAVETAGCCCGDSCDMTAKQDATTQSAKPDCCAGHMSANHATTKHDMKNMKTHDMKSMKTHDMKNGCCCCGDSCDMEIKKTAN
jgi:hypothetical protein